MAVVDGRRFVAVVDVRRSGQRHPRSRLGGQTMLDTLEAHPHSRVHCSSHTLYPIMVHPACRA